MNSWQREEESSRWRVRWPFPPGSPCPSWTHGRSDDLFPQDLPVRPGHTEGPSTEGWVERARKRTETMTMQQRRSIVDLYFTLSLNWFHSIMLSFLLLREHETLAAGTKPRTSHHRSPGGERRGKRKRFTIFFKRKREGHRQSVEHWNCFKGNVGETAERLSAYGLYWAHRYHLELNWTDAAGGTPQLCRPSATGQSQLSDSTCNGRTEPEPLRRRCKYWD